MGKEWCDYGIVLAPTVLLWPPAISSITLGPLLPRSCCSLPKRSPGEGSADWSAKHVLGCGVRSLLELFQDGVRGLAHTTGRFLDLLVGLLHGYDHPDAAGKWGEIRCLF